MVSAEAEFSWVDCDPKDDEFLVLASDGLWDVMSSQDAVDFVKKQMDQRTRQVRASFMGVARMDWVASLLQSSISLSICGHLIGA